MSFEGTSSSESSIRSGAQECNLSSLVIGRPDFLDDTCTIETVTERLPLIEPKIPKRNRCIKGKESVSESLQFWLKPGISLPKLRGKQIDSENVSAVEPLNRFHRESFKNEWTPSSQITHSLHPNYSHKCFQDVPDKRSAFEDQDESTGPSKCRIHFEAPLNLSFQEVQVPEEKLEPSHALKQWELWMMRRKNQQDDLCKKVGKSPCNLVMHQGDHYRKVIEDKAMFSYAQMPGSTKWKDRTQKRRTKDIKHFPGKRKQEKFVPEIEFIGIPKEIQKEKGLVCEDLLETVNAFPKEWEKSSYRKERCQRFKKQRMQMRPHEIEMEELVVIGQKIPFPVQEKSSEASKSMDLPTIIVTEVENSDENCFESISTDRQSIAILVIANKEMKYEPRASVPSKNDEIEESIIWEADFGLSEVGTLVERILTVENRGTMAIGYEWIFEKPVRNSRLIPKTRLRQSVFFFNKNPGIFIPGQKYEFKFYHHAKIPGIERETWHLKTGPPLGENTKRCYINLSAIAVADPTDKIESLNSYMNRVVAETIVKVIIDQIFFKMDNLSDNLNQFEYKGFFLEEELFEYHNPKYYYHGEIVKELKGIFQQIPLKPRDEWDLSLDTLVSMVITFTAGELQYEMLQKISQYAKMLLRPKLIIGKKMKVYRMIYEILCKTINSIDKDYMYLRSCFFKTKETFAPEEEGFEETSSKTSDRIKSEEFKSVLSESLSGLDQINLGHFRMMFYIMVYENLYEAMGYVAGIIEADKFFKPWKQVSFPGLECEE